MLSPYLPLRGCIPLLPLRLTFKFVNNDVGVPIRARWAVVIEAVAIVCVSPGHQHWLQAHTRQAVGSSRAPIFAHRGFRERNCPLWCVIENANSSRDASADDGARHHDAVVVVSFHPIVVENTNLGAVLIIQPEWLDSS